MKANVAMVGVAHYNIPLDIASEKKFYALNSIANFFVVGLRNGFIPKIFEQNAQFILLPHIPIPTLGLLIVLFFSPILLLWLVMFRNVRVIIAQSPLEGASAVLVKQIAQLFNIQVRVVIESHGDFESALFLSRSITFSTLYKLFIKTLSSYSLKRADRLRAVSNATKVQLQSYNNKSDLFVYPAWMQLELFYAAVQDHAVKRNILFAGTLLPLKGVDVLIEAYSKIKNRDDRLLIVGPEENTEHADMLRKLVVKRGLQNYICFLGALDRVALAREMGAAKLFVLPSRSEAFGRVLVEALAAGTPVVGAAIGGIPEIIDSAEYGFLFTPESVDELTEILENATREKLTQNRMARCQQRARELYSEEGYLNMMRNLIYN
jgi:glycosyltransferase involved in cell wall biosynthesis